MATSVFDRNPALATASILGIAAPVFASGFQFALSHLAIPPLLGQPQSFSTPVFAHIYRAGALVAVPLSVLGLAGSSAAAYLSHGYPVTPYDAAAKGRLMSPRTAWVSAALLCASIPVFTALFMKGDIDPLLERADGFAAAAAAARVGVGKQVASASASVADDELVRGWLASWRRLNFVRSGMMGTAACFAAYAIFTAAV